ncbi:hypothetical protein CKN73_04560 [Carnobacterium divergens]|uniref:hypothetical protein n=1 Tax=Carnobacterium divergens TaxID=2748 RepID=UPI001072778F|nr:hypothetical protein [Carnobacterium divergens]TFJ41911.1 hypothetical protein CKN77_04695 [Carnobacterium divergens]TFJ50825.1 hypothetical protein CKN73_04560 [Carnobacterium divergens]TFJ56075.1 hypothetical protein CKN83_04500 [Carnobacterium divergens]TFJ62525.1 hypothetical protein CKN89_04585 [Carnobacterium divergens]TFJ72706.1 hypothetical protein CKN91_04505 [Carnobacterium divergens]
MNDAELRWLAEQAYWVDSLKNNKPYTPKEGNSYYYNSKNPNMGKFEVLKIKNNVENGMQAMAVAPIKNGKPDTSQVVIAFAGTNADEGLNILTDTQTVELNKNTLDISTKLNFNGYNKYTNQRFKVVKSMYINF